MKNFINEWTNGTHDVTYEKGNAQNFLRDVTTALGKDLFAEGKMEFEHRVLYGVNNTQYIDAYLPETGVIIEMKKKGEDLTKAFLQAEGYYGHMKADEKREWIICCDCYDFHVYNMRDPRPMKTVIKFNITELEKYAHFLKKILFYGQIPEEQVTVEVTKLVSDVYDLLLATYRITNSARTIESLNKFIMRFIFCAFAEDQGVFKPNQFTDYISYFAVEMLPQALAELWLSLSTPVDQRDSHVNTLTGLPIINDLAMEFPYLGGTLFSGTVINHPKFTDNTKNELLNILQRDWSIIPGSLFGTIFECTFNPEKRHKNGMHYTTTANIHKVIDLLFLNELKEEYKNICEIKFLNQKQFELHQLHDKIAGLTFLDPACGSGNFLIETYKELRELENLIIIELSKLEPNKTYELKVSCKQFYGIEYVDFAHQVAQMSMYIAVCQEYKKTCDLCLKHHIKISNLTWETNPLILNDNIKKGNALTCSRGYVRNWKYIGDNNGKDYSYIFGNPPYLGYNHPDFSEQQRVDSAKVFKTWNTTQGKNDYVANWFILAVNTIKNTNTKVGFVSTNSINQGVGAKSILKPMLDMGVYINYAYSDFDWDSAASVVCSIIGFSFIKADKIILNNNEVDFINQYLRSKVEFVPNKKINTMSAISHGPTYAYPDSVFIEKAEYDKLYAKNKKWLGIYALGGKQIKYGWCFYNKDVSSSTLTKEANAAKIAIENFRKDNVQYEDLEVTKFYSGQNSILNVDYMVLNYTGAFNNDKYTVSSKMSKEYIPTYGLYVGKYSDEEYSVITSHIFYLWMKTYSSSMGNNTRFTTNVYKSFPNPDSYLTELAEYGKKISDYVESSDKTPNELFKEREGEFYELLIARDKIMDKAYGIPEGSTDEERLEVLKNKYLERVAAIEAAKEAEKAAKKAAREAKKAAKKAKTK